MIRQHENVYSLPAGFLAVAVHALLFAALFFSVNWKSVHIASEVMEVELWDQLPAPNVKPQPRPKPTPKPVEKPIEVEPPKPPEPEPEVLEKPVEEPPKVDIALEQQKKEEAERLKKLEAEKLKKKKAEERARKRREIAKKLLQQDEQAEKEARAAKLAQAMLEADEKAEADRRASAAMQGVVDQYISKIQAKVRGNVNKSLCGDGDPELKFKVDIMPTGDIARDPQLVKSSGLPACDEAVNRAILASQPLPLPKEPQAKAKFRNLKFTFRPND